MSDADFASALERASMAFREELSSFKNQNGVIDFPSPLLLNPHHVAPDARLFAERYDMIAKLTNPGSAGAEIGVWRGDFSRYILDKCAPEKLHLFDIDFERFGIAARFEAEIAAGQVEMHLGDSRRTVPQLPDGSLDWAYIDAGHAYEEVAADAAAAIPKLKPDGVLFFNDYIFWAHTEARPYGVIQAVNEVVVKQNWQIVAFAMQPQMWCDIAIKRRAA